MTKPLGLLPGVEAMATFSNDERYRYTLHRRWGDQGGVLCWIMLNPSTATAETDDATIRKCQKFARAWGYDEIVVVNLFALRSRDPQQLLRVDDPVGPCNDHAILSAVRSSTMTVAAWGTHGTLHNRHAQVRRLIDNARLSPERGTLHALKLTKDGHPWHPLYVPDATTPIPYR